MTHNPMLLRAPRSLLAASALLLSFMLSLTASADPFPPSWSGGAGGSIHHAPAPWPTDAASPSACGASCGQWKPYTRFNRSLNDPRVQDPSNGGTAPQNYVNVSSSCTDKAQPSIYYYLHRGATPAQDVIMFRWRVEQIANNYATGSNAGAFGSSDPWSSGLWTVLFDVGGSGFRDLAAHINGSSGSPSTAVDMIAGIYGKIPTQSIDYLNDPVNIKLLGHNPTAFAGAGGKLLNFAGNVAAPTENWPNGASETVWDYGTTRAIAVSTRPCTEYFIDYQIPVAMLDATAHGGPKIDRSTPIAMLFCTANSLNNPFQKDCAISRTWQSDPAKPGPFGDYISFDQSKPYDQPIVRQVIATAPSSCGQTYTLKATVQDTLAVDAGGNIVTSVQQVSFWYYYDANGDGISNDAGSSWTHAINGTLVPGTLNEWQASWDSSTLPKGRYLIGVQALDDNTIVDDGMTPSGIDNRTFSYVTSNSLGEVYVGGAWATGVDGNGNAINFPAQFPTHASALTPGATENWYGNPLVTGIQVATTGVDLAINACGVAPALTKSASSDVVTIGQSITYTLTVTNPAANPSAITLSQLQDALPAGFSYTGTTGGTLTPTATPTNGATGLVTWSFSNTPIAPGASATLIFTATASSVTGTYTNNASAVTSFGTINSNPLQTGVGAARLTLAMTPSLYSAVPGDTVTYTLTYSNDSPINALGVTLTDALPTGITYVAASCTGGCAYDGGTRTLSWNLGDIASGQGPYTLTFQATIDSPYGGAMSNQDSATISSSNTAPASATASVYVATPQPQLTLNVTSNVSMANPGGTVIFTLNYANVGNASATSSVLTNVLPAGFTFVSATGGGTNSAGTITWNLGTLAANASGSVTVTATVTNPYTGIANPAIDAGSITATALGVVTSTASVGVLQSGTQCNNYYFTSTAAGFGAGPVNNLATTATPVGALSSVTATLALPSGTATPIGYFFQDPVSGSTIDFSTGTSTLSGQINYTKVGTGNLTLSVATYDYDPATGTMTALGAPATYVDNGNATPPVVLTAGAVTGVLQKGHRLLWVVSGINNTTNKTPGVTVETNSSQTFAQVCAQPPANFTFSKTVDTASLNATGTGRSLNYTLKYANTSSVTQATNVAIVDTLPTGVTFNSATLNGSPITPTGTNPYTFAIGTVAGGGSGTLVINASVANDLTGITSLINNASLASDQTNAVGASAETTVIGSASNPAGTPNVLVSVSADKTLLKLNDTVTYTLTVVNAGDKTATSVAVSDVIPASAWYSYVASSITGGDTNNVSGNTLSWTINSLAPGATATLTFQMDVAGAGVPSGVNTADDLATLTYAGGGSGSATSNTVTVSISTNPNLIFTKSATTPIAPATAFAPGDFIEYTLTLINSGSGDASDVVIYDPLPTHISYAGITQGVGSFDAINNQMVFDAGTLAAGGIVTYKFEVKVTATLASGSATLTNNASVASSNSSSRSAQATSNLSAAPSVTLNKSGPANFPLPAATLSVTASSATTLTLSSTALLNTGDYLRINGTVTRITAIYGNVIAVNPAVSATSGAPVYLGAVYNLTYTNSGNAAAENLVVTDTLPAGLLYVTSSPTANTAPAVGASGTVKWNVGTVAAGASGSVQLIAIPTTSGSLINSGTLTYGADPANPDPCATCASNVTTQTGGLTVTKRTTTAAINAGGVASYVITVSNSLASAVSNVSVTDRLPSGFSYKTGSGTPAPSTVTSGLPTWTALTVPANGSINISFSADVAASVGGATYQNEVEVTAPAGVGVTGFDPLSTTAEDVTVLASGSFVIDGYVYRDLNADGVRDTSDPSLVGVAVEINDDPINTPYVVYTDGSGYFRQVVPAGTWTTTVPSASNTTVLSGLRLWDSYIAAPQASSARTVNFGYVDSATPAATMHALSGTVFNDLDGNGTLDAGESGSNAGGLNVAVIDAGNNVVQVATVAADGTWSVNVLAGSGYTAYLTTATPVVGSVQSATALLPGGWVTSAAGGGVRSGIDASVDRTALDFAIHASRSDVYARVILPAQVNSGGTLNALITFGNQGDLNAASVGYTVTGLPTGLAGVTCGGASCFYDSASGTIDVMGLPNGLSPGEAHQVSLSFTAPASGAVSLTASISTTTANDPAANNDASATSNVTTAITEVATVVNTPANVAASSAVTATVTFVNLGSATASGVTYALNAGGNYTVMNGATACTYDNATGAVSGCGLSNTLNAGQSVSLSVTFTAPASGSVTVTSTITATNDTDPANNSASGISSVIASTSADVSVAIAVATKAGSSASVPAKIAFTNGGPATATGLTYTLSFTGADAASVTGVSCDVATCTLGVGGAVTVTGLPTTLEPGQSQVVTLTYTGPVTGTVDIAASIATSATDPNTNNNSASATTGFSSSSFSVGVSANPAAGGTVTGGGTYANGTSVTVDATAAAGYTFADWSEGGTSVSTAASYTFTVAGNRTLVANFTANNYTLTYDSNGATGGTAPVDGNNYTVGASATVVGNTGNLVRTGYTFAGWNTAADGTGTTYSLLGSLTFGAGNVTLYAKWVGVNYTVTFDLGTGSRTGGGALSQSVASGGAATAPTVQPATGWTFAGWDVAFNNVTSNLTVKAIYQQIVTKVVTPGATINVPVSNTTPMTSFTATRGGTVTTVNNPTAAHYGSLLSQASDGTWNFNGYQSGRYVFTFTDASGNQSVMTYTVYPSVSFATARQTAANGDTVTVRLLLDDKPVDQIATISYGVANGSLATAPTPSDLFTRAPMTFDIDSSNTASVFCTESGGCYTDLKLKAAADSGAIQFTLLDDASLSGATLGSITQHTINLIPLATAPIRAELGIDPGHVVLVNTVPVVPAVSGLPLTGSFNFNWSATDAGLGMPNPNASAVSFTAPPTPGLYRIRVTVTDANNAARAPISLETWLRVIDPADQARYCGTSCTSDASGIPEGMVDTACKLGATDPLAIPYRLQVGTVSGFDNTGLCVETSPGYGLRMGVVSLLAAPNWGAGTTLTAIAQYGNDGSAPVSATDSGFSHVGIDYDFEVINLDSVGQAVPVVIPLPWATTIPAGAVWRKFNSATGWFTFVEGNGNLVHSAPRVNGSCPSPVSSAWSGGLVQGNACVRLTIVDGGPNDLDGVANGVIKDPGTLAVVSSNSSTPTTPSNTTNVVSRGGGGAVDLLLLGALALGMLRRVRRVSLLCAGLLIASAAQAQFEEGPWYVGAMGGVAKSQVSASDVEARLRDLGLSGSASVTNQRTAWRLFGGYQFTDTWSVEFGYTDLGKVETRINGVDPANPAYLANANTIGPRSGKGPELSVLGRMPVTEQLHLYGRVGLLMWDAGYTATADSGGSSSNSGSGTSGFVGIGGEYRIDGPWAVRASLDRYRFSNDDVDALLIGVVYRFGTAREEPAPVEPAPEPAPEPVHEAPPEEKPVEQPVEEPVEELPTATKPITWIVRYDFDLAGHEAYQEVIDSLADFLKSHPDTRAVFVGHTDSHGSRRYNARLSLQRARELREEVVKRGVERNRMKVEGHGFDEPVATNSTDEGRALNRRTEIHVYSTKTE